MSSPSTPPLPSSITLLPWALGRALPALTDALTAHDPSALFLLDYDGTLSAHVPDPARASLTASMRTQLERLLDAFPGRVVVISGRSRSTLIGFLGPSITSAIITATSHGHVIEGPNLKLEVGAEFLPDLAAARDELQSTLHGIPGALVEDNLYSITTHTRCVAAEQIPAVHAAVLAAVAKANASGPRILLRPGAHVLELRPDCVPPWHKGAAALHLLHALSPVSAVCAMGDDLTDEDTFKALLSAAPKGTSFPIIVAPPDSMLAAPGTASVVVERPTSALYALRGPAEVETMLAALVDAAHANKGAKVHSSSAFSPLRA